MNRYTFKAKRKDNGEWIYGSLLFDINTSGRSFIVENGVTSYESSDKFIGEHINTYLEIDKDTICQYTGLQDIDGNYIFENDMLENYWGDKKQILECKYYDTGLVFEDVSDYSQRVVTNAKIIGNKFDKEVE